MKKITLNTKVKYPHEPRKGIFGKMTATTINWKWSRILGNFSMINSITVGTCYNRSFIL